MKKRILCYGDSNTWGYNGETATRFPEDIRWTGQLQTLLGEEWTIIEEGMCSRTTVFDDPIIEGVNGLTYLHPCLSSQSPIDYLIIMLGTNDCKQRFALTPKNIAEGLKLLAARFRAKGASYSSDRAGSYLSGMRILANRKRYRNLQRAFAAACL